MRAHSDGQVAAALAELEATDEAAARNAAAALGALTQDAGLETITQHRLQTVLWDEIPRTWRIATNEQLAVADALGQLFELLDLPRYAGVCRSADTAAVLAAWSHDETSGLRAYRRADERSGVAPPDLGTHTNPFVWGSVQGADEARAFHATAAALELSLAVGDLVPGSRGWRTRQRELTHSYLCTAQAELDGHSWLDLVQAERRHAWQRSRSTVRRRLLARVDPLLDDEIPVPAGAADAVEPLRWLLEQAEDGLRLTETRRLARDAVVEAARHFGWYDERRPPRTETDVVELHELHVLARDLRLVRRRGPRLVLTEQGRALLAEPLALWHVVAAEMAAGGTFDAFVAELALGMLLCDEGCESDHLVEVIAAAAAGEGWRDHVTAEAPGRAAVTRALWTTVRPAKALGLLVAFGSWHEHTLALTLPGRGAALVALRANATGPQQLG